MAVAMASLPLTPTTERRPAGSCLAVKKRSMIVIFATRTSRFPAFIFYGRAILFMFLFKKMRAFSLCNPLFAFLLQLI